MSKRGTGCGTAVRLLYAAFDNTGRRPALADAGRRAVGSLARGDHMNILDAIVNARDGAAVQQLGSQVGLAPDQATAALSALMPALAGGFQRNIQSQGGVESLMAALSSGNHSQYIDNPASLADSSAVTDGNGILGHLLGSKDASRE